MSLCIKNGIALVVATNFIFGAATLGYLGRSGTINVGKQFAILIFDDLGKGAVGLDKLELIATLGINLDSDASIERNTLLIVGDNNLFGGVETVALTLDFFLVVERRGLVI